MLHALEPAPLQTRSAMKSSTNLLSQISFKTIFDVHWSMVKLLQQYENVGYFITEPWALNIKFAPPEAVTASIIM